MNMQSQLDLGSSAMVPKLLQVAAGIEKRQQHDPQDPAGSMARGVLFLLTSGSGGI